MSNIAWPWRNVCRAVWLFATRLSRQHFNRQITQLDDVDFTTNTLGFETTRICTLCYSNVSWNWFFKYTIDRNCLTCPPPGSLSQKLCEIKGNLTPLAIPCRSRLLPIWGWTAPSKYRGKKTQHNLAMFGRAPNNVKSCTLGLESVFSKRLAPFSGQCKWSCGTVQGKLHHPHEVRSCFQDLWYSPWRFL